MRISTELLKILVCPITKEKLIYDELSQELVSISVALAYPIVDGIPMMLASEARPVSESRIKKLLESQKDSLEIE